MKETLEPWKNLSTIVRIALHIVSEQKDKLSMKRRLYKAALETIRKNYWNFDAVALISGFFANIASKLYVRWTTIGLLSFANHLNVSGMYGSLLKNMNFYLYIPTGGGRYVLLKSRL